MTGPQLAATRCATPHPLARELLCAQMGDHDVHTDDQGNRWTELEEPTR